MKYFCTSLLVSVSFSLWAQLTITRSDYGNPGDRVLYAVDTPIYNALHTGLPGEGRSWNFMTNQTPRRYDSSVFLAATADPQAPGIPVNLLMRTVAWGDVYQEVTNTYVKSIQHFPQYNVKGVVLKTMSFPLSYGTKFSDSAEVVVKGTFADFGLQPIPPFDSIRIEAKVKLHSDCDGWGLLTLPDSTAHNSLRVQNIIDIHGDVYGHFSLGWTPSPLFAQQQQITSYQWYGEQSHSYLANVTVDSLGRMTSLAYRITSLPKGLNAAILSCTPDSFMPGEKVNITIRARNTHYTEAAKQNLYMGPIMIDTVYAVNDTTVMATVWPAPGASSGMYLLQLRDPYAGTLYLPKPIRVLGPPNLAALKSISPGYGTPGTRMNIRIYGTHTHFAQGNNFVSVTSDQTSDHVHVNSFSVENDSVINCTVLIDSMAVPGNYSIYVSNSIDGYLYLNTAFSLAMNGTGETILRANALHLYPNPVYGSLTADYAGTTSNAVITLSDMTGRICRTLPFTMQQTIIDVSDLDPGIYLFRMSANGQEITRKIVIQH